MKLRIGVFVAAASLAGSALAEPKDTSNREADWLRRPSPESLMAVWPAKAIETGQGGKALIRCKVSVQGSLFDCRVVSESPEGAGFGGAALALTPQFLMKPAMANGAPVESEVGIPINFPGFTVDFKSKFQPDMPMRRVLTNVPWKSAPTYADAVAAYPVKAREAKQGGHVTLHCTFTKTSTLAACSVLNENPHGLGFGGAAKLLAKQFVGPTAFADGKPLKGIDTQIHFTFAPEMLTDPPSVVGRPKWAAMPQAEAFWSTFPPAALKAGVSQARVVLRCRVGADGGLEACAVESEAPAGYEIGKAALGLAPGFRLGVWSDEGLPVVGGYIGVPIRYQFDDAPPKAP